MSDYDHDTIIYQTKMGMLSDEAEFTPVRALGASLSVDGNQFCWLFGDNIQEGISGFGDTPHLAMLDFNKCFYTRKI